MTDLHNHLEDNICHICNNTFQSVSDLKQHLLTHDKIINQISQFFAVGGIFSKDFKDEDSLEEKPNKKNHDNNNQEISFEPSKNHTNISTKEKENNVSLSGVEFKSVVKVRGIVDSNNAKCIKTDYDAQAVLDIIEDRRSDSPSNESIANKDVINTTLTDLSKTGKKIDNCVLSGTATLSHQTLEETDTLQSCTEDGTDTLKSCTEDGTDTLKSCTEDGTGTLQSCTEDGTDTLQSCTEYVTDTLQSCTKDGTDTLRSCTEDGSDTLKSCAEDGTDTLKSCTEDVTDTLQSCMSWKSCGKVFENEILLKVHLKTRESIDSIAKNSTHISRGNKENTKTSSNQLELTGECPNEGIAEDQTKTENCAPLIKLTQEITHGSTKKSKKLFKCKLCNKNFNRPSLLHSHSLRHTGEKPILCSICGKYYASKYHLKLHMKTHANNNYYTCEICGKEVKRLEAHLRSHSSEKRFTCEICGNRYMHKGGLTEHKKLHNTKDKWYCDHCNKSFSKKRYIQLHIRDTHLGKGASHTCHICKKKILGGKGHLKVHVLRHSGVKAHECNICGKKCAHAGDLKMHMFTHSNEQPFSCEQCEQRFKRRENLKTHMLIHTGEKPHKCGICGQKFRQRGSVKIHMRNIHSK